MEKEAIFVLPKAYNFQIGQFHYFKLQEHNIEGPKNKQFYFWGVASFHDNDTGVPDKKKSTFTKTASALR